MVTKDEARKYLSEVPPERCFWVNNGSVLKNLDELASALPGMSNDQFRHHVSKDKNDFSSWVNDIIGDKSLANELLSSKNKESAMKKLQKRISVLKKKAG